MNLRLPYVELASLPKRLYSFASIIEGDSIYVIGEMNLRYPFLGRQTLCLHVRSLILFKNNVVINYIFTIFLLIGGSLQNVYSRNALIRLLLAMKTVFMY